MDKVSILKQAIDVENPVMFTFDDADIQLSQKANALKRIIKAMKAAQKAAEERSRLIDEQLKRDWQLMKASKPQNPLILLGSGDSGKSTVLKQLKLLYGGGFAKEEAIEYKKAAIKNIIDNMTLLVQACQDFNFVHDKDSVGIASEFLKGVVLEDYTVLPANLASKIKLLWRHNNAIQQAFERGNEFNLQDTATYDLDKWTNASYVPTEEDILHIRVKTTAISTFDFKVKNSSFSVIDVGGQKSLRQYWIPYFEEDLKAIIFVASLACYDQTLADEGFEDINRMEDSLALFRTICEHPTLQNKAIILFLNKLDLFEKKIKTSSIRKYVPDFNLLPASADHTNLETTKAYFRKRFLNQNPFERNIYVHFTNSTDCKLMKVIITAVSDIVLRLHLAESGIM